MNLLHQFARIRLLLFLAILIYAVSAKAEPGRCFKTGLGDYACEINLLEFNGSFAISAPGKPTYSIVFDGLDFAFGFVNEGDGNRVMAGIYRREEENPSCWANVQSDDRICAE